MVGVVAAYRWRLQRECGNSSRDHIDWQPVHTALAWRGVLGVEGLRSEACEEQTYQQPGAEVSLSSPGQLGCDAVR